jgi:hypothetical protein
LASIQFFRNQSRPIGGHLGADGKRGINQLIEKINQSHIH